tara:strand:- start:1212 stop:2396 length:1185 start_codon:yes stop_codon:yes gene_type:complete
MKNKLFHKHIDLKSNPYFLDYVQIYLKIPTEDLKPLPGFNFQDIKTWNKWAVDLINNEISREGKYHGIRLQSDLLHHGIRIYFEGQFFIGDNITQDIAHLKNYINDIKSRIQFCQYSPNSWQINNREFLNNFCSAELNHYYISRFDLAQNCYSKLYPEGLKHDNYDTYIHKAISKSPNCVDISYRDNLSQLQTGYAVGNPKFLTCKVYSKRFDTNKGALDHALKRFKTYEFWRREWRVQKKKIKSMKINHLEEFLLLKNKHIQKEIISSIRKSVDVVLKNDSTSYNIFHFTHIDRDLWTSLKDDSLNLSKRVKLLISGRQAQRKAISDRKNVFWNGASAVHGTIKGYVNRWSLDQWVKVQKELLNGFDRLPISKAESNVDIKKVKEFLEYLEYR